MIRSTYLKRIYQNTLSMERLISINLIVLKDNKELLFMLIENARIIKYK